jgi:hypothetical protein
MPAHLDVEPLGERGGLEPFVHQRSEHREEQRHQQRGRAALSRHVADRDDDASVRQREDVVEVPADGVGRPRQPEGLERGRFVLRLGEHRVLDVARDLQVVLEREPVGHLEQDEQVDQQETDKQTPGTAGAFRQPDETVEARQDRHAVENPARGREPQCEGPEEQPHAGEPPAVP